MLFIRPVDVTAKEAAVAEKLERDREHTKERVIHTSMSRTSSRTGTQRGPRNDAPASATPSASSPTQPVPSSPKSEAARAVPPPANVRPSFSFASAAAGKKEREDAAAAAAAEASKADDTEALADKVAEVEV